MFPLIFLIKAVDLVDSTAILNLANRAKRPCLSSDK